MNDRHHDPHNSGDGADADRAHGAVRNGRVRLSLPAPGELDELAELFLGPENGKASDSPDQSRRSANPARELEGLVLGHLPILAAAWPSQYARHRADELGEAVALVRLASGMLSVELVGSAAAGPQEGSDWRETIRAARSASALVLLRVDEPAEAELVSVHRLGALRLLSGADDAAIVGCYRKLKGLAAAAEAAGVEIPRVAVAVMGAPRERALAAHERIARAARAFLEADLPGPVVVERIGRTGSTLLFQGAVGISLEDLVQELQRESAPALRASHPPTTAPEEPRQGKESLSSQSERPCGMQPASIENAGSLSTLAGGLTLLESRCPLAERIELAVDPEGRLHLVGGLLAAHPALSTRRALRDLLACAAWARQNARLLARAEGALNPAESGPVLHLVTDRAAVARTLLGTPVRVHLAVEARPSALGLVSVSLDK